MKNVTKISESIHRLTILYKDIYTTVYTIKTDEGILLFDTASYDSDISNYVVPFLEYLGINENELKCIFISHNHKDHAGGLKELMKKYHKSCIISCDPVIKEEYADYNVLIPDDGDMVLGCLKIVTVPGHTKDSAAIYDSRTKTLLSGDCLQLYGIFGSGNWGANIRLPKEHIEAIDKLKKMDIEEILTAHDYHPYGHHYIGKETVEKALDACVAPLYEVKALILENPRLSDDEIANLYNNPSKPTLGKHVVTALRNMEEML